MLVHQELTHSMRMVMLQVQDMISAALMLYQARMYSLAAEHTGLVMVE